MRIIIAGSRPPKEIRTNRPLLEKWYLSMYGFVETCISEAGFDITEVISGTAAGMGLVAEGAIIPDAPLTAACQVRGYFHGLSFTLSILKGKC